MSVQGQIPPPGPHVRETGAQIVSGFHRVVEFLAKQDEFYSEFDEEKWTEKFLDETKTQSSTLSQRALLFQTAKDAFQKEPHSTIRTLERFADCVATEDLAANFLVALGSQDKETFECWLWIQTRFNERVSRSEEVSPTSKDDIPFNKDKPLLFGAGTYTVFGKSKKLETLIQNVQDRCQGDDKHEAAKQIKKLIEKEQKKQQGRLEFARNSNRTDLTRLTEVLTEVIHEAKPKMWHETGWIVTYFRRRKDLPFGSWNTTVPRLKENLMDGLFVKSSLLALNLIEFATMTIGCDDNDIKTQSEAISRLRIAADDKKQQWKILYDTIVKLQGEVSKQNQIITSLEYRHALENLPNKNSQAFKAADLARRQLQPNPLRGASGAWHTTWEMACREEITRMVQLAGTTPPTTTDRPLERLLRYDFDNFWKVQNRQPSLLALGYFQDPYQKWSSYEDGKNMYGLLSDNIHGHGSKYEADSRNWPRVHNHFFEWLKPIVPDNGDVDWDDEWQNQKALPL